jgi:hypothetical protein
MSKGSRRRPGKGYESGYDRIFDIRRKCVRCLSPQGVCRCGSEHYEALISADAENITPKRRVHPGIITEENLQEYLDQLDAVEVPQEDRVMYCSRCGTFLDGSQPPCPEPTCPFKNERTYPAG